MERESECHRLSRNMACCMERKRKCSTTYKHTPLQRLAYQPTQLLAGWSNPQSTHWEGQVTCREGLNPFRAGIIVSWAITHPRRHTPKTRSCRREKWEGFDHHTVLENSQHNSVLLRRRQRLLLLLAQLLCVFYLDQSVVALPWRPERRVVRHYLQHSTVGVQPV